MGSWLQHLKGATEPVGSVSAARNDTEVTAELLIAHRDKAMSLKKEAMLRPCELTEL
jgi:hypothetical protein